MREIVLDLETTGFYIQDGHRITEVGAIELIDGKPTGREFHAYVNPERDVPEIVTQITGLTGDFLSDKALFPEIAKELYEFIGNDPIIVTCHVMTDRIKEGYMMDQEMLDMELENAGFPRIQPEQWVNIRKWGEEMYGYKEASLNNVLQRFGIDCPEREDKSGHGALLDAKLLADVYPKVKADYLDHIITKKKIYFGDKGTPPPKP